MIAITAIVLTNNILWKCFRMTGILESEIDEWTETYGIKSSEAEQEKNNTDRPYSKVLFFREISIEHKVLNLFPKWEQGDEGEDQRHDECGAELQTLDGYNCLEIKSEESGNEREGIRKIFDAENGPAHRYDKEGDDDAGDFAHLFIDFP